MVSRRAATSLTPEAESDAFFEQTAKAVPTLRRINKETFVSPDGSSGTSVTISFEVAQVMLVQKHVFRIDGGILTQLVATVDEARKHELEEGLEVILQSFESTS